MYYYFRYIAGYVIRAIVKCLRASQTRRCQTNLHEAEKAKEQLVFLRELTVNKNRVDEEIEDRDSLEDILTREYEGASLTYVGDETAEFFYLLWSYLGSWFSDTKRLTRKSPSIAYHNAIHSHLLSDKWEQLFTTTGPNALIEG